MSYLRQLWGEKGVLFPREATGAITLYPQHKDPNTGIVNAIRCVIDGCMWKQDSISILQKTGAQIKNNVSLYIPYMKEVTGRAYLEPSKWDSLPSDQLEQYWTIDLKRPPLVISGECQHQFTSSQQDRIATLENQFLQQNSGVRRVSDINPYFFGSVDMWHIVVRC